MVFDSKQIASKFLDGDLKSKDDLEQLVADEEAKLAFSRYQMISHTMKNEAVAPEVCIAGSVMAALSNEATVLAPRGEHFNPKSDAKTDSVTSDESVVAFPAHFGKQLGGMAIAASVALVALLNFGNGSSVMPNQTPQTFAANPVEIQAPVVDRAQLQQAHELLGDMLQNNAGLPVIQTVSNQQAVAIKVLAEKEAAKTTETNSVEPNSIQIKPDNN